MSELVSADEIETIVGAERHESLHLGRAVSAEQVVYLLHPHDCLNSFEDLRDCPYSRALDRGIDPDGWVEDAPVMLGLETDGRLTGDTPLMGDDSPAEGHRTCNDCDRTLPEASFGLRTVRGVEYYESVCRECKAKRTREWRKRQVEEKK